MPPLYPATAAMILALASLPVPSPRRHGPVPSNPLLMSDRVTRNVATLVHVQYTCIWLLLNLNKLHGVSRVPGVRRRCTGRRPGPGRKTARAPNPCLYLYVVKGRSSRAGRCHRTFTFSTCRAAGELKIVEHGVYGGVRCACRCSRGRVLREGGTRLLDGIQLTAPAHKRQCLA